MTNAYLKALRDGADRLQIPLTADLAYRLYDHHQLVAKWARKINLTTVTEPAVAATRHGLDSLLFAQMILAQEECTVADVGSGAGFPGVVLALARPKWSVILLEPIRKRASFLRVVRAELGLERVEVIEGRLEEAPRLNGGPWPVPWIVSRATIPPLKMVAMASGGLSSGGYLVLSGGAGAPSVPQLDAVAHRSGLRHDVRGAFVLPGGESRVLDRFHKVD